MRELRIGEQTVRVRATPLALLFYKQEFKGDLMGDLLKMMQGMIGIKALTSAGTQIDMSNLNLGALDSILFAQLIWAMAKADAFGRSFPSFAEWLAGFETFDVFDSELLAALMEEAASGFFRTGVKAGATQQR